MIHLCKAMRFLVVLVLPLLLGACQTLQQSRVLLPAHWIGMQAVQEDVWVERTATSEQRVKAIALRDEARSRVAAVVGVVQSSPKHLFCFTEACYQGFGGGSSRARSFSSLRTLMGPDAFSNADVAHEWWHVELFHRLGYWSFRMVPRWFDEGLAVWVSDDPRYGETMYQRVLAQGIVPPTLQELETMEGFIAAVGRYGDHLWASKPSDAVTVVYPTSAHEVRRWMGIVGLAGLKELVAGLARGESFETLYPELERRAR